MLEFGNYVKYNGVIYRITNVSDDDTPVYTLRPTKRKTVELTKTVTTDKTQNFIVISDIDGVSVTGSDNLTLLGDRTAMAQTVSDDEIYVIFESNGGSDVDTQTINSGEAATEPTDPTLDGNTFDAWYSDSELTTAFDFSTALTEDTVLYAGWTENV